MTVMERWGISLALVLVSLGTWLAHTPTVQAETIVVYVDADASGSNDGTSWANAYLHVQDALDAATPAPGDTVEIWVAAGVYYPDEGNGRSDGDRSAAFQLKNNVALYGGFAGGESSKTERQITTHLTVLSGDIDQDDTTDAAGITVAAADIVGDNSYHVVNNSNLDSSAVLDGFVITAGQATGSDDDRHGGGMLNTNASLSMRNLVFTGNEAVRYGGGLGNFTSDPTLTNVIFRSNLVSWNGGDWALGGGIYNDNSNPVIANAVFTGNQVITGYGGGMYSLYSEPRVTNAVFFGNEAGYGGALYNDTGTIYLTNITIAGNRAIGPQSTNYGGGISHWDGAIVLSNSIIWGNQDDTGTSTASASLYGNTNTTLTINYSLVHNQDLTGSGSGNLNGLDAANDPQFVAAVPASSTPTSSGDYRLRPLSPLVDLGDNTALLPEITTDLIGNPRFIDGDSNTVATVDFGAYEVQPSTPVALPDFDGDGNADLLWNDTGTWQHAIWFMDANIRLGAAPLSVGILDEWQVATLQDFDADGRTDILWRNTTLDDGRNVIWLMDGATRKAGGIAPIHTVRDVAWELIGSHDFDGDDESDLLWHNTGDGRNVIWLMDGTTRTGIHVIQQVAAAQWEIAGTGDFDSNGTADILWRSTVANDGRNVIWLMDGPARQGVALLNSVSDLDWNVMGIADANGDGSADIFWRNLSTGDNVVWLMNGTTRLAIVPLQMISDLAWDVAGFTPFNDDTTADILWRNGSSGENMLWPLAQSSGEREAILALNSLGITWQSVGLSGWIVRDGVLLADATPYLGGPPLLSYVDEALSTPMPDEPPGAPMDDLGLSDPMEDEPPADIPPESTETHLVYLPLIRR